MMSQIVLNQGAGLSADTWIEGLALFISALAFIGSIIALVQNRNMNITNLQARYFEEIFKEYVVKKIPDAVEKLCFEEGRLSPNYKELNNVMMDMICSAKYYAYAKHDFYSELKAKTQNLEDKLIIQAGKKLDEIDLQVKFVYEVHQDIMDIVTYINQNYHKF